MTDNLKKEDLFPCTKNEDKNVVKEGVNDPAFYNDQIDSKNEPIRASMQKDKTRTKTASVKTAFKIKSHLFGRWFFYYP